MLLVSSLDVFDCCGLELGGECPYPDPNREEDGRGVLWRDLLVPLTKARVPFPAQERAWPGHRGQIWPAFGNTDKPSPGPKPLPRVKWTDDRYRDEDTGSDPEFGEPQDTAVLWGSSPQPARAFCPQGHCLEDSGDRAAFTYSSFARSRDAQGAAADRRPGEKKRDIGGGRVSRLGLLPVPLPGCSPGGPDVLRPLKPLVLSPQETWLAVCEWFTLLCSQT